MAVSITASLKEDPKSGKYTVFGQNAPTNGYNVVDGEGVVVKMRVDSGSSSIYLTGAYLYLGYANQTGGVMLKKLKFVSYSGWNRYQYCYINHNTGELELHFSEQSNQIYNFWDTNGWSEIGGYGAPETVTLTETTPRILRLVLWYELTSNGTSVNTYTIELGTITPYGLSNELSINTTNVTTKFYKNKTFSYSGLVTTFTTKYNSAVGGNIASTSTVTPTSVTKPDMTTTGTKTITVSYNGYSRTYSIEVVGVNSGKTKSLFDPTTAGLTEYVRKGTAKPTIKCTVYYTDGTIKTQNPVTISGWPTNSTGTHILTLSTADENTGETVQLGYFYAKFCDYNLTFKTAQTKTTYYKDENYSSSGAEIIKQYYDSSNKVVNSLVDDVALSDLDIEVLRWAVGIPSNNEGGKVKYSLKSDNTKTLISEVNIDGLYSISISGQDENFPLNGVFAIGNNAVLKKTVYSSGVASESTESTYLHSTPNMNSIGKKSVRVYVTGSHGEGEIECNYNIYIYQYSNLVLNNQTNKIIVKEGDSLPTLAIDGNLVGDRDYSVKTDESVDVPGEHYSVSPAVGSSLALGENSVTITALGGATYTFSIFVENIAIDDSVTTLDYSGLVNNKLPVNNGIYLKDQTVSLEGLVITAPLMTDTSVDYVIKDYDKQLVLHSNNSVKKTLNDLKFVGTDTLGWYDLLITRTTYNGENVASCTIENAVCFKGVTSITYNENAGYGHGYYINGTRIGLQNRVKIGDAIDLKSIKFRLNYSDNTHEDIFDTNGTWLTGVKINNVAKTNFLYADRYGIADYFILDVSTSLGGTINVSVPFLYLDSITITNTKTSYDIHDQLNLSKITITKNYVGDSGELYEYTKSEVITDEEERAILFSNASFSSAGTGCAIDDLIPESTRQSASVTLSLSKQEGDYTGTTAGTTTLTVKALRGVTLYKNGSAVTKLYYDHGETHSLVGHDLYVVYNNNDTETISITDAIAHEVDSLYGQFVDNVSSGGLSGTITYTYHNDSKQTTYTRHTYYVSDITVTYTGVESEYFVGQVLNVGNVTGTKTISCTDTNESDTTEDISEDLTFDLRSQPISSSHLLINDDISELDENEDYVARKLYARYNPNNGQLALSDNKDVVIKAVTLTSISLTKGAAFKDFDDYFVGQYLNLYDLTINLTYNNSAINTSISFYDDRVKIVDGNNNEISKSNKQLTLADNGVELYVKFESEEDLSPVLIDELTVTQGTLESIEIRKSPNKVDYRYGDTFSLDGIIIVGIYDDGTREELIYVNDNDLSFSLTTSGSPYNPVGHVFDKTETIADNYVVTVTYLTETATFKINIKKPILKEILTNFYDPSEPVRKVYSTGDTFSSTGLIVKAVFKNGYQEVLTGSYYTLDDNHNPLDSALQLSTAGFVEVFVQATNPYDNGDTAETSFFIEVNNGNAVTTAVMQLNEEESYNSYFVGERFTAKGVSFIVKDSSDNTFVSKTFSTDLPIGTVLKTAQNITVNVTYTNGTYTKTESYVIKVRVLNSVNLADENSYQLAIGDSNNVLITSITHEEATIVCGKQYDEYGNLISEIYPLFHEDKVSVDTNVAHTNTYGYNIYTGNSLNISNDCIGYIDLGVDGIRNAHIVLFDDPVNPIDGNGNIEVTFPHYVKGHADKINKCQFGYVFHNRLFLSGNPDVKNCDWHTQETNDKSNEYTYFSDLDYCYYGNEETAIVGYDQYRDGDLIVVKEGSRDQATLYRREYKLVEATAYDGSTVGEDLYEEAFPMFDINSNGGEGGLSQRSIVNFVGETLVLTRVGLKAITAKDNVFNSAKYALDVSSYINTKIIYEELENAFLYTFEEKVLLKTSRGVYVGYHSLRNHEGVYEWYFLNNIDATIFFEYEHELYFANDKGVVCRFPIENFDYLDKARIYIGTGGTALAVNESENSIVTSVDYKDSVVEGADFHLITNYTIGGVDTKSLVHASLGTFISKAVRDDRTENDSSYNPTLYNGTIVYDDDSNSFYINVEVHNEDDELDEEATNEIKYTFYDGRVIYLDNISGNNELSVRVNEPYTLKEIADNRYKLFDKYGDEVSLFGVNYMRISFAVNDLAVTKITDIQNYGNNGAKQFKLIGDHDRVLDLINYDYDVSNPPLYSGVITSKEPVKAYYETAPYVMGTLVYLKTILSWTIVNDTALAGYMDIGYFASRKQGDWEYSIRSVPDSKGLDLTNYKFVDTDFTNRMLPAVYARQKVVPSVAFIRFLFKNDNDSNMVLTTLNLVYTIANLLKGVK